MYMYPIMAQVRSNANDNQTAVSFPKTFYEPSVDD